MLILCTAVQFNIIFWRQNSLAFIVCSLVKQYDWLRMIAADWRTHSPNWLVWSEDWRPPGTQSFIKWTGWTLAMTMSWWQHH